MKNHVRRALQAATLSLFAVLLGACGGRPAATATPAPTATPTPISAPLPPVATVIPFGSEDRPYRIYFVPPAESDATGRAVEDALIARSGSTFRAELVTSQAEVLAALCSDNPSFGWVDGWTMLAAIARGCARPLLSIERLDGSTRKTGFAAQIIVGAGQGIADVNGLRGRDFCRLSDQDVFGWVLPALSLRAAKFDPFTDFRTVRRVPDTQTLLREVVAGNCAAGLEKGTLGRNRVPGLPVITTVITPLNGLDSPEIPFGGLVVSPLVPDGLANAVLTDFLQDQESLEGLVQADGLTTANVTLLVAAAQFFQSAGLDFVAMSR